VRQITLENPSSGVAGTLGFCSCVLVCEQGFLCALFHERRMSKYCLSIPRIENVETHLSQTETFTESRCDV
jgi:hypothetical protein